MNQQQSQTPPSPGAADSNIRDAIFSKRAKLLADRAVMEEKAGFLIFLLFHAILESRHSAVSR